MEPFAEHRGSPRIPISYQVKLVVDDQIIAFRSALDLSLGGLLLGGNGQIPVGTECGIAILLGSQEPGRRVVTRGTVVRVDGRGTAIAFNRDLDPAGQESLRLLIDSLSRA